MTNYNVMFAERDQPAVNALLMVWMGELTTTFLEYVESEGIAHGSHQLSYDGDLKSALLAVEIPSDVIVDPFLVELAKERIADGSIVVSATITPASAGLHGGPTQLDPIDTGERGEDDFTTVD